MLQLQDTAARILGMAQAARYLISIGRYGKNARDVAALFEEIARLAEQDKENR